jgi:hypothetical protein
VARTVTRPDCDPRDTVVLVRVLDEFGTRDSELVPDTMLAVVWQAKILLSKAIPSSR